LDDDWIKAGMGLGLIGDGVVFGVRDPYDPDDLQNFVDSEGTAHYLEILGVFPGPALEYQGPLSDLALGPKWKRLWDLIGWEYVPQSAFRFKETSERILVDIDLDAFVMPWEDYVFPWEDEVFEDRFLRTSDYFSTAGLDGEKVFSRTSGPGGPANNCPRASFLRRRGEDC